MFQSINCQRKKSRAINRYLQLKTVLQYVTVHNRVDIIDEH